MKPQRTCLITGAASGIGAALARLLIAEGHRVALADIDTEAVSALADTLGANALGLALDIRDEAAWTQVLDRVERHLGGLDVLVNNAAVFDAVWAREQSDERMRALIDTNLLGLIHGTRQGLARFERQGHGHIVNVGSIAGFTPLPGQAFYAATKHAVRAWHHAFAMENRDRPVEFTLVLPGSVDTPMIQAFEDRDAAGLAFAGPILSADAVARKIARALRKKPREVAVPRAGAALMRHLGVHPGAIARIVPAAFERGWRTVRERASRCR